MPAFRPVSPRLTVALSVGVVAAAAEVGPSGTGWLVTRIPGLWTVNAFGGTQAYRRCTKLVPEGSAAGTPRPAGISFRCSASDGPGG